MMDKEKLGSGEVRPVKSSRSGVSRVRRSSSSVSQPGAEKVLPVYNDKKKKKKRSWKVDDDEGDGGCYDFGARNYGGKSGGNGSEHNERENPFSVEAKLYKECSSLSIFVPPKSMRCDEDPATAAEGEGGEKEMPLGDNSSEQIEAADDSSSSSSSSSSNYEGSPQVVFGSSFQATRSAPNGCIDIHGSNLRYPKTSQNNIIHGSWKKNIDELYRVKRDSRSLAILRVCKENDNVATFNGSANPARYVDDRNESGVVSGDFDTLDVSLDDWLVPMLSEKLQEFIDNEVEEEEDEEDGSEDENVEDSDYEEGEEEEEEEEDSDGEYEEEEEEEDNGKSLDDQLDSLSL